MARPSTPVHLEAVDGTPAALHEGRQPDVAERDPRDRLRANRHAWDLRTRAHLQSAFYDVPSFRNGRITLRPPEREELGDVSGRTLLHLQCHFGLDTLSWARL